MRRTKSHSITLMSCLVTLLWVGPGCVSDPGPEEGETDDVECNGGAQSDFLFTEVGENQYLSYQQELLDAPISEVWPEIRDIERFVKITLPDAAPTFMWLDGGGPEVVPSRFQFAVGGTVVPEEIIHRSEQPHQILVRLVEPAVGLRQYYAFGNLKKTCGNRTLMEYSRHLDLDPATDPESFKSLFTQEFIDLVAYFKE